MTDVDEGFGQLAADRHRLANLRKRLERIDELLDEQRRMRTRWRGILERADETVRKLEGMGITALFHALLGDRTEQLDSENAVLLRAKVRLEDVEAAMEPLLEQRRRVVAEIESIGDLAARERELVRVKDAVVRQRGGAEAERAITFAEREGRLASMQREIDEAIAAGRDAATALGEANDALRGAHGWGAFDLLGGGFLAAAGKYRQVDVARSRVAAAQRHLDRFARELRDVQFAAPGLRIDIGALATFADWFLDGLLVDWIVLRRIETAQDRVREALRRTRAALVDLEIRHRDVAALLASSQSERAAWLGTA